MNKNIVIATSSFFLFVVLMYLIRFADVSVVGPLDAKIGLSTINLFFKEIIGVNETCYIISKYIGTLGFVVIGIFGLIGLIQWIQRKDITKVDNDILALGSLYVVTLFLYFLFTFVAINYRPVLLEDEAKLEASFPSSHSVLAIVVSVSNIIIIDGYIKNKRLCLFVKILLGIFGLSVFILRVLSGAHWFSDIIGGLLLSNSLIFVFIYFKEFLHRVNKESN